MTTEYIPSAGHMLYIPVGLLMLFFGGFLVKAALYVVSCTLVSRLAYDFAVSASLDNATTVTIVTLAALTTFLLVLEACNQGPLFATGAVLGSCIALTFYPAPLVSVIMAIIVLSAAFGLVFSIVPKEVSIFITSYGGGYMIFFGMELIDNDFLQGTYPMPLFVRPSSLDMWFSVLSFLVVGLLGCCVQLILISGRASPTLSPSYYIDIP